jgi:hypothetical protein
MTQNRTYTPGPRRRLWAEELTLRESGTREAQA